MLGRLHRAYVALPGSLCGRDRPMQERTVFFETAHGCAYAHLQRLLALAWGVDTSDWAGRGCIYNCHSARDLYANNTSCAPLLRNAADLRLFECGWGGPDGIGAERVHYSRAAECDLVVTPRVHARLSAALAEIERLYAGQARVCAKQSQRVPA